MHTHKVQFLITKKNFKKIKLLPYQALLTSIPLLHIFLKGASVNYVTQTLFYNKKEILLFCVCSFENRELFAKIII